MEVARHIGAVRREVRSAQHDGKSVRVVVAGRTYATSADDLWDVLTNPDRIPRWFLPVTGDLRLGGRFQLEGNAGGVIERCEPPTLLAVTWEFGGDLSWVVVRLTAADEQRTSLELEHTLAVSDEWWDQFGAGSVGVGWDMALMGMDEHVGGAPPVERAEMMAWLGSDEGDQFVVGSVDGWCAAQVAAGADPVAARAAADRSREFYRPPAPVN